MESEFNIYICIGLSALGVLSHFLKKKVRGQTLSHIANYFSSHFKYTLLSLIGASGGFFVALQMGELNYLSAFGVGYLADSFFNKVEEK
jgi:hypothetical protein